ncbi:MAG: DNA adenine methylase [Cyanobacteria bacterium REEB417]|nr:DNA adenine methylase [Cyanobacteria bacterium REEB417]
MSLAAPFPYFGGKRRAAPRIWQALGDPSGYVEPFAGSAAVLLARPPFTGRRVETLNDVDGWLVNAWRAIQLSPDAVAAAAWGPVAEIDYHARLAWLQQRRTPDLVAWLEGDPEAHDAKAAGWWLYVLACGIGDPFGPGPWRVVDGHLRKLPHLANAGKGVNRELPHLGNAGQGVNRELPHLGNAGRGQLQAYMRRLADRLQRVRITCGSWERVVKPSVTRSGTGGDGTRAIFLDPPYATSGDLYAESSEGVAEAVRAWCLTAPRDLRVILCGYDAEHDALLAHGWSVTEGKAGGGAGYSVNPTNGRRERLWLSPACIGSEQPSLFPLAA